MKARAAVAWEAGRPLEIEMVDVEDPYAGVHPECRFRVGGFEAPAAITLERRQSLGGFLPRRRPKSEALPVPPLETFRTQLEGTGEREAATS